jgi:coenzyme F420 hydrogenase subunit beta
VIGNWVDVFSARSTNEDVKKVATDGGVVTYLLSYLLDSKKIDGAIVSKRIGACGKGPIIATSKEELIGTAGSYFSEALHLDKLGTEYASCFPVIKVIQESAKKNIKKLALVGTPCQIKAIRKMQLMNIVPADMVIFTIGLFCLQCFTLEDLAKKEFAKIHNINMDDIVKVNIKDKLILTMKSGICVQVPLDIIEKIARPACIACDDFANDYADISVGGIGSDEGFTTVLIRNSLGREVYSDALYKKYIENKNCKCMNDKDESNYLIDIIKEFAIRKKARAEKRLNSLIK